MLILIGCRWTKARPIKPYAWRCSKCEAVFDIGPLRPTMLTDEQVDEINSQFEEHCRKVHPRLRPAIGLNESS
jgi:ribosomal protein L37AE/L43A